MTFSSEPIKTLPDSLDSTLEKKPNQAVIPCDLNHLLSIWHFLDQSERLTFCNEHTDLARIVDSVSWMRYGTKTLDDQDPKNPYKPFPNKPYFDELHRLWEAEPILFIEKSRTMMATWFFAAEFLHEAMIRQPSTSIFWAQDMDRAQQALDYCWVLWEQQDEDLKAMFPLARARALQARDTMELAGGSQLLALPGKDPSKIRSRHPTRIMIDEACFVDQGAEAFDVALASKVPRVVCISSAAPSWFRDMTRGAVAID